MRKVNYLKEFKLEYIEKKEIEKIPPSSLLFFRLYQRYKDNNYQQKKLYGKIITKTEKSRIFFGQLFSKEYSIYGEKRKERRLKSYFTFFRDLEKYLRFDIFLRTEQKKNIVKIDKDKVEQLVKEIEKCPQNKIVFTNGYIYKYLCETKNNNINFDYSPYGPNSAMVVDLDNVLFEMVQKPTLYLNCSRAEMGGVIDFFVTKYRIKIDNNTKIYEVVE